MAQGIDISEGWLFRKGRVGRSWAAGRSGDAGETVDLPHCWNVKDDFQEGVAYYRGSGGYRKLVRLPAEPVCGNGGQWTIESAGFYGTGDVWMNGRRLGKVDGEFLGFRLPASGARQGDEGNVVAIRLTNRCARHVLPGIRTPDFLLYGGLSGGMFLRWQPDFRIADDSLRVVCSPVGNSAWSVRVGCVIRNDSGRVRAGRLRWAILPATGPALAAGETAAAAVAPGKETSAPAVEAEITEPALWSPETPCLYTLRCELEEAGAVVGAESTRFGFRTARFERGKGFFLNGRRIELRGCNRHESLPGFGRAMPPELHRQDAMLLKETGFNLVRLSHYPQAPAFLDACDELGLMVYPEIATWKSVRTGRWLKSALRQMDRMIRRDRNRPGVILWGMGNESRSKRAYLALRDKARELDPDRPVIYAENHYQRAVKAGTVGIPDVWGCNYEIDRIEDGCAASRLGAVLLAECSNTPAARRGDRERELAQVGTIERDWALTAGREYNAGHVIWCMNDYGTLRKDRYLRYSGVFDAWRLPKMARALLQAAYLESPFMKVYADWRRGPAGELRQVHVFTNCGRVRVISGGGVESELSGGGRHLAGAVRFEDAELVVTGEKDGRAVEERVRPFGPAARIEVVSEAMGGTVRTGRAVVGILLRVADSRGETCADWSGEAEIAVSGPARERTFTGSRKVPIARGIGRTFVQGTGVGGRAVVAARNPSLAAGECGVVFTGTCR